MKTCKNGLGVSVKFVWRFRTFYSVPTPISVIWIYRIFLPMKPKTSSQVNNILYVSVYVLWYEVMNNNPSKLIFHTHTHMHRHIHAWQSNWNGNLQEIKKRYSRSTEKNIHFSKLNNIVMQSQSRIMLATKQFHPVINMFWDYVWIIWATFRQMGRHYEPEWWFKKLWEMK